MDGDNPNSEAGSEPLARFDAATPASGVRLLTVAGELDCSTAPAFEQCALGELAETPEHLILDLAEVTFLASAGLRALLVIRERATEHGVVLHLTGVSDNRPVAVVLGITHTTKLFDVCPTVAAVLAEAALDG